MYDSLMCSHEPNGRIFTLDANGAIPEITNRMLVRAHPGSLDLLPALPKAWPRGEIRGIKALKSILDAPDDIDVVHMVIPAKFVPQAVDECGQKGVKNIIINSGGFSETGAEGAAYEKDFLERAKKYGIRMLSKIWAQAQF